MNYFLAPRLPADARIVIFPGDLEPYHAIEGRYGDKIPQNTPLAHLAGLFRKGRPKSPLTYLRHYIRPTPWVAKYWRE